MIVRQRSNSKRLLSTLVVPFLLGLSIGGMFFGKHGERRQLQETVSDLEQAHTRSQTNLQAKADELEETAQAKRELEAKVLELEKAVADANKAHADTKKRNSRSTSKLYKKIEELKESTEAETKKVAKLEEEVAAAKTAHDDIKKDHDRAETKLQEKRDKIAELEEAVESADKEKTENAKGHKVFEHKLQLKINELEEAVAATNKAPERVAADQCMQEKDGFRPVVVTVATQPRTDLLGAFTLPTLFLLAVAHKHHWSLEIMPLEGSQGEKQLMKQVKQGHDIDPQWGSGFVDANNREDYDPVQNNRMVHETLGFFPKVTKNVNRTQWISVKEYPPPGEELEELCREGALEEDGILRCKIWLPDWYVRHGLGHDHNIIKKHILENGGFDAFFTKELRRKIREKYIEKNGHRVTHFSNSTYDVAMHVRRGDEVQSTHPDRWIIQPVYATIIRRICKEHSNAVIHVFSAGKNADGGFKGIEEAKDVCKKIIYHLDEVEFDTWAHFVAADEFVMSKSTFSYVPALFAGGKVHYPSDYWFGGLSDWSNFNSQTGELI